MILILVFIFIIIFTLCSIYKLTYQYKGVGWQPYSYRYVKNFLNYTEFFVLWIMVGILTSVSRWYLILIPIDFIAHHITNFLCFKRESDRLYNIYISNGKMKPEDALETANMNINMDIKNKKRF